MESETESNNDDQSTGSADLKGDRGDTGIGIGGTGGKIGGYCIVLKDSSMYLLAVELRSSHQG